MTDHRLRVTVGSDQDGEEVLRKLDDANIEVVVDGIRPSWAHQVAAIALVDLLGRLFPRVTFDVHPDAEADAALPPGPPGLTERLDMAHQRGGLVRQPVAGEPLRVLVGRGSVSTPVDLHVDAGGWQSYLGPGPSALPAAPGETVAVGPLAAACRAAAALSQWVLGDALPAEPVYSSALDYASSATPIDNPEIVANRIDACLVGAGSVGGAAVYTMAYTPGLHGRLVVVDPQTLEEHNPVRALLADVAAASVAAQKVWVAAATLGHHSELVVTPVASTVTAWHATLTRDEPLPLMLVAVDSVEARRAIQDCLPLNVLNAACHPLEITVSGHRTDDGPCVCCLHMAQVLDRENVSKRLIAVATGMPESQVNELMVRSVPLTAVHLRRIEEVRGLPVGALARYDRRTLLELWNAELMYGAVPVGTSSGGTVAVAAPYVTALAGVLLAAEALKASLGVEGRFRLGTGELAIKYEEHIVGGPTNGLLTDPPRWESNACLCRSTRRLRLMHQRYGAAAAQGGPR